METYSRPRVIDLGSVTGMTEGIKDLLTDNHNGTWQHLSAVAKKAPAKKAQKAAPKKAVKKAAVKKTVVKKTAAKKKK